MKTVSALAIVFALGSAAAAHGQATTATLRGIVTDVQGAVVRDARVTISNLETAVARPPVASGADGAFQFLALVPGRYRVRAALDGFASTEREIELRLDEVRTLTLVLEPAGLAEHVAVSGEETAVIERSRTSLGRLISRRQLDDLPVPTGGPRDFTSLARLSPGMSTNLADPNSGLSANGQSGANTYVVDGLSVDGGRGNTLGLPPLEAVDEFIVVSSHISAEFGQASGAVLSIVTRAGTNTPSGRLYWLQQDEAWNAASAVAGPSGAVDPGLRQSSVGGSWSGPLVTNRVFTFLSAENTRRHSVYVNSSSVARLFRPDDALTLPFGVTIRRLLGRVDANLASSNTLKLRISHQGVLNENAGREVASAMERGRQLRNPSSGIALFDTQIIGASAIHELAVDATRYRWLWTLDGFCDGCATINYPSIKLGKPNGAPSDYRTDRVNLVDTLAWLARGPMGRHAMKAGVNASYQMLVDAHLPNETGQYSQFQDVPFNPDDASTYPGMFQQNFGHPSTRVTSTVLSSFIQDDWHAAGGVSLNLGLRWDHTRAPGPWGRRDDVAPRMGIAYDPRKQGWPVFRAGAGRYFDELPLSIARDVETGLTTQIVTQPGYQGDPRIFDPYGPSKRRTGPLKIQYNLYVYAPMETPYSDQVSVGLQQPVGGHLGIAVDVVRARGHRLPVGRDLNYPDLTTGIRPNPDPGIRQVITTETAGQSWYTGVQVAVERRMTARHAYSVAYAWASAENNTDGARAFPQNQLNLMADRGPSPGQARHQLTMTGTLEWPYGLRLSSIVSARSGLPYNVITNRDDNRDGVSTNDRPSGIGRNSMRGGGLFQADLRLSRVFRPRGRRIELLIEAFNVTNHANWTDYNGITGAADFGKPGDAGPPRQLQVGVRWDLGKGRR